jgi:hypothetical protein
MGYIIQNSTLQDIDEILLLYKIATDFQKKKFTSHWPAFDRELIETEIYENRQWKLIADGKIACIWATTFEDPQIWEERNQEPAVYLHRIATNPDFRGNHLVEKNCRMGKILCRRKSKEFYPDGYCWGQYRTYLPLHPMRV